MSYKASLLMHAAALCKAEDKNLYCKVNLSKSFEEFNEILLDVLGFTIWYQISNGNNNLKDFKYLRKINL